MMSSLLAPALQEEVHPHLRFEEDEQGLVTITVNNALASAQIAMQGAHVTSWRPHREKQPVLWLSSNARHIHGRSIRGGVPVCWPWFGPHPSDPELCPHGFARTMPWRLVDVAALDDGATRLVLQIVDTPVAQKQLAYPYQLTLTITVGETLSMVLATRNDGDDPFVIGEALHTYFNVSDVEAIRVDGLEGVEYADKVLGYAHDTQHGPLAFASEFDRVYLDTASDCVIRDPGFGRAIRIAKTGSQSTVVWTPWQEKAAEMADMGSPDEWRHMICVESANALENQVTVPPHTTHTLTVTYSVNPL